MPRILPIKNLYNEQKANHPRPIGDGGGLPTSGRNISTSYGGSKSFGISGNGPSRNGGSIL